MEHRTGGWKGVLRRCKTGDVFFADLPWRPAPGHMGSRPKPKVTGLKRQEGRRGGGGRREDEGKRWDVRGLLKEVGGQQDEWKSNEEEGNEEGVKQDGGGKRGSGLKGRGGRRKEGQGRTQALMGEYSGGGQEA